MNDAASWKTWRIATNDCDCCSLGVVRARTGNNLVNDNNDDDVYWQQRSRFGIPAFTKVGNNGEAEKDNTNREYC